MAIVVYYKSRYEQREGKNDETSRHLCHLKLSRWDVSNKDFAIERASWEDYSALKLV